MSIEDLTSPDPRDEERCSQDEEDCPTSEEVAKYLSTHPQFVKQWLAQNPCPELFRDVQLTCGQSSGDHCTLTDEQERRLTESYSQATRCGRNSVTSELFRDMVRGPRRSRRKEDKLSRRQLQTRLRKLDEHELLMQLIQDIANELNIDTLCHKILMNVGILTNSDRTSLFLAKGSRGKRFLVAKLFDITPDSILEEAVSAAKEQTKISRIPFGVGIVGHTAETKETVNIKNAYEDPRFNKEIDARTGYRTVSIMCMPILNYQGDVIGVAQCINKVSADQEFTEQDEEVFKKYLTFCGIGIQNAQLFEMSVQEYKRNEVLLSMAQSIFEETSSLDRLINKIMVEAQGLLQCEKCRVYLVDFSEHSDKHAYQDPGSSGTEGNKVSLIKPRKFSRPEDVIFTTVFELRAGEIEVRRPSLCQLTGPDNVHIIFARDVAATGQTLNWMGEEVDCEARLKVLSAVTNEEDVKLAGSVVSIPIFSSETKVIGVAQLVNRQNGQHFTEADINTFEGFAIFCGLGIYNTQMYENAIKLMAKQKVALEMLSYHASSSLEESNKLVDSVIPSATMFNLYSFEFSDFPLSNHDTCTAALRMFVELDLIQKFCIPYEVMCRWILSVRKNYRPVIYHNWRHALNVAQTMFAMLTTGKMRTLMSDLDMLALLVACLSHDLDHRGTNNSFQTKIGSPLATLYSSSTMEHHHFDHCIRILYAEGNNILQSLSAEEYKNVIHIVECAILSTDLALYLKKKERFVELAKTEETNWTEPKNMEILRGIMMTACDVAAICKPWKIQREVAELVASEFFQQGDLEKEHLNQQPIAMMDREKKDELPKMQVDFIDYICMPIYSVLAEQWSSLKPLHDGCIRNRQNWEKLSHSPFGGSYANKVQANGQIVQVNNFTKEARKDELTKPSHTNKRKGKHHSRLCALV